MTTEQAIDTALAIYACEDIQIDAQPDTRKGADGTWVAAWVFVSNTDMENDE
jgi:hypothetical protein